tara:strand:+ start:1319 stop:1714 length:396 start_codon:yes stop_codon:yes gene_type:complete
MTVSILGLSGLESIHLKPSLGTFQHYKALLSVVVHLVTVINYLCVEPVHLFLQNWSCECHRVDPYDGGQLDHFKNFCLRGAGLLSVLYMAPYSGGVQMGCDDIDRNKNQFLIFLLERTLGLGHRSEMNKGF